MCFTPKPPPPPPPPAPVAPLAPLASVAPAEGSNRRDAGLLAANRGRGSLRIDRTLSDTGSSGSGLNIPS
ncbi:hypothetical protein UFOVP562_24 [uncultured Caudovirales phage]|uniref:Uncharacterized protein n=1 Tax=uncultured Caudovirales phage TaxID=2100421 RepID=A0A6J5MW91_9CAUD|nr:hypothetical protein UFOVP562_24 [uncultured Caudovirales phage]